MELERHVRIADDEGLRLREEPRQRAFQNVFRTLNSLGIDGVVLIGSNAPRIVQRIYAMNNFLFRPQDKQAGGIHLGAFMFRDIFCRLSVPVISGTPVVDFMKLVDLSDYQKSWLSEDEASLFQLEDQASDLLDFGYGSMEFRGKVAEEKGKSFIFRAHTHLEAAAATATGAFDYRGTIQSALLGTELALKAGLAAHGVCDEDLKKIGHNLKKAATRLSNLETGFDVARVTRVINLFPDYVKSRYEGPQPSRIETGHVLMGAQYIASEVTRQFSDRDIRASNPRFQSRSYPP